MPNPLPNRWYWHHAFDCPVYVREVYPDGTADYDRLVVSGCEWPSAEQGTCKASELDPWPLKGLCSESLMESKSPDG